MEEKVEKKKGDLVKVWDWSYNFGKPKGYLEWRELSCFNYEGDLNTWKIMLVDRTSPNTGNVMLTNVENGDQMITRAVFTSLKTCPCCGR